MSGGASAVWARDGSEREQRLGGEGIRLGPRLGRAYSGTVGDLGRYWASSFSPFYDH